MNIRKELFKLQDIKYKDFQSSLTKTRYPIIGIRIPELRNFAKKETKNISYISCSNPYFEEVMLEGMNISFCKDIELFIKRIDEFIPKIDDWSVCDIFCSGVKNIVSKNKDRIWDYIVKYASSNEEFENRFMIIMMMDYYLEEKYLNKVFDVIDNIKCDKYYCEMAIAWLIATSLAKFEKETLEYMHNSSISKFSYNKAISKACESYRINDELKIKLKKMKRGN